MNRLYRLPTAALFILFMLILPLIATANTSQLGGNQETYLPLIQNRPEIVINEMISGLDSPSSLRFAPDGRLFISERITGRLMVAHRNNAGVYNLQAQPFYVFNTPRDANGNPELYASGGLRDIVFDPDFANNGHIYAFYMSDDDLQNRVVRITKSNSNPNVAGANSETLIMHIPFNNTQATGSHNGGALQFGPDGKLYISTGDGLDSDPVQSITTFTGKLLRINKDGSIPSDNPFYTQTSGNFRAIYALGLRNPFSMSIHPTTNVMYVNDVTGNNGKAVVYEIIAGANYRYRGPNDPDVADIGIMTNAWARPSDAGGEVLTGGVWIPNSGPFSDNYAGAYITALWGSNNDINGQFNYIVSDSDTSAMTLVEEVGVLDNNGLALKPTHVRRGPDGKLYFLLSTYQTSNGQLWVMIP